MLVLSRSEVEGLLDLDALLDALAAAHAELSAGEASLVPRVGAFTPAGVLGSMVGYALPEEIEVAKEDVHFRLPKEVAQA